MKRSIDISQHRAGPRGPHARVRRPRRGITSALAPKRLHAQLACERARADRGGVEFAAVRLRVSSTDRTRARWMDRLVRTVLDRIRATDDVGWFDNRSLCILLPDTPAAGARIVAQRVLAALALLDLQPGVETYSYPAGWTKESQANRRSPQLRLAQDRDAAGLGSRNCDIAPPRRLGGAAGADEFSTDPHGEGKPMVSTFFTRPLPLWKRAMDIVGALFALTLFAPLLAAAAIAIRLTSPGPIIFTQRRSGLGGRVFNIFKFRTMCVDAEQQQESLRAKSEQDGPAFKLRRDPRVTRIGALLRKTSIDELPQLFNVLKGDMSLVGPRPLPVLEQQRSDLWHQRRLDVTPGMTCVWQIRGRNSVTFDQWVRMDVEYITSRSIWSDLKILVQTLPAVVLKRSY